MCADDDSGPIGWREVGAGAPVLFLHGLGGSRTAWDPQLHALGDRFRCVAWDMPGYGVSAPLESLTFPALADAVVRLLDLLGEDAAHIVGLSLGGMIAMHTALAHPGSVLSLALLDTSPRFGTDPDAWIASRLEPLERGKPPAAFARDTLRAIAAPGFDPDALEAAVAAMARIPPGGFEAAVRCVPTHDVAARLGEISVPTIVLVGEFDRETPPAYAHALATGIPGAQLEVVPGAGHLSNLEQPDAVNEILARWLRG